MNTLHVITGLWKVAEEYFFPKPGNGCPQNPKWIGTSVQNLTFFHILNPIEPISVNSTRKYMDMHDMFHFIFSNVLQ